jgi:tetratricopeptide (TPR) repeat protein
MMDHEYNWAEGATMLASEHWRCAWFDPIVAVFVHDSADGAVRRHLVDFTARHFRPDAASRGRIPAERAALAKAFRNLVGALPSHRTDLVRPLVWLGIDECRAILADDPDSLHAWKMLGQTEFSRDPSPAPPHSPRYRLAFDPVADLSLIRATYAMNRVLEMDNMDITTTVKIEDAYARRGMHEEAVKAIERLTMIAARHPNPSVLMLVEELAPRRAQYLRELSSSVPGDWRNMAELDRVVTGLLATGRARGAADALEKAYPSERAPWDVLDQMATLRLHLGEPAKARTYWQRGMGEAPDPAVAAARIAATYLAEEDFEAARKAYRRALGAKPELFEACYGLAVLEADAGDAAAATVMARKAVILARDDRSREAAASLLKSVEPFADAR